MKKHFRFNKRRKHPSYVFKEKNGNYHSIIVTHSSHNGKNIKLYRNPNRNDSSPSYFVPRVYVDAKSSYGREYKNWKLSYRDKLKYYRIKYFKK